MIGAAPLTVARRMALSCCAISKANSPTHVPVASRPKRGDEIGAAEPNAFVRYVDQRELAEPGAHFLHRQVVADRHRAACRISGASRPKALQAGVEATSPARQGGEFPAASQKGSQHGANRRRKHRVLKVRRTGRGSRSGRKPAWDSDFPNGAALTPSAYRSDKGLASRDLRAETRKGIHDFHGWPAQ